MRSGRPRWVVLQRRPLSLCDPRVHDNQEVDTEINLGTDLIISPFTVAF